MRWGRATGWRSASTPAPALPLVVAVTSLGVKDGQMRASTAAGLVGAAMLSVMVFPLSANAIRRRGAAETAP